VAYARGRARALLLDWRALETAYVAAATERVYVDAQLQLSHYLAPQAAAVTEVAANLFLLRSFKRATRRAFARMRARFDALVLPVLGAAAPLIHATLQARRAAAAASPARGLAAAGAAALALTRGRARGRGDSSGADSLLSSGAASSHRTLSGRGAASSDGEGEGEGELEWDAAAAAAGGGGADEEEEEAAAAAAAAAEDEDSEGAAAGSPARQQPRRAAGAGTGAGAPSPASPAALTASAAPAAAAALPHSFGDLAAVLRRAASREEEAEEERADAAAVRELFCGTLQDRLLAGVSALEPHSAAAAGSASPRRGGAAADAAAAAEAAARQPIDSLAALYFELPASTPALPMDEAWRELSGLLHVRGSGAAGGAAGGGGGADEEPPPPAAPEEVLRRARRAAAAIAFPQWFAQAARRPALPFVALTSALFALDPLVAADAQALRKTACALLCVGFFSGAAALRDPTVSAIVPDLVCRACSAVRDVDLAREEAPLAAVASRPHARLRLLAGAEAEAAAAELAAAVRQHEGEWLASTRARARAARRAGRAARREAAAAAAAAAARGARAAAAAAADAADEDDGDADADAADAAAAAAEAAAAAAASSDSDSADEGAHAPVAEHTLRTMREYFDRGALAARGLERDEAAGGALARRVTVYSHEFSWACAACLHPYDGCDVESALVAAAEARSLAYTLQDLACTRCARVRGAALRQYCECSGRYETVVTQAQLRAYLRALLGVAVAYGFAWLRDTVQGMLAADGGL